MELTKRKLMKRCVNLLAIELAQKLIKLLEHDLSEVDETSAVRHTKKKLVKPAKKKRLWVKKSTNHKDPALGLSVEISFNDPSGKFLKSVGIEQEQFSWLLNSVSPLIQKRDTIMRDALPAHIKLKVVLGYLILGGSYSFLSDQFQIPRNSISSFLLDVMSAICDALKEFIKVPKTDDEWKSIEKKFNEKYGFPNCYASLDGRCIEITSKRLSTGSKHNADYYNVEMVALVDANHCFTFVDIETTIRNNTGKRNFDSTSFGKVLKRNDLNLPSNAIIVANCSFPLKDNIMIPYTDSETLSNEKRVYNNHTLRVVRVSNDTFRILCGKFRVFGKTINVGVDRVPVLVKSCCSLHNWLRKTNPAYLPAEFSGVLDADSYVEKLPVTMLNSIGTLSSVKSITAIEKRNWFVSYFNRFNNVAESKGKCILFTSVNEIKMETVVSSNENRK